MVGKTYLLSTNGIGFEISEEACERKRGVYVGVKLELAGVGGIAYKVEVTSIGSRGGGYILLGGAEDDIRVVGTMPTIGES